MNRIEFDPALASLKANDPFRHTDGGLYRFVTLARHTEDTSPLVVYEHIWPFEPGSWARPAAEWSSRFSPISTGELLTFMKGDRQQAQADISAAKAARRAKEGR